MFQYEDIILDDQSFGKSKHLIIWLRYNDYVLPGFGVVGKNV